MPAMVPMMMPASVPPEMLLQTGVEEDEEGVLVAAWRGWRERSAGG